MALPKLTCLIAGEHCARFYDEARLDAADQIRLRANPGLDARTDWRVSRFLKQQAVCPVRSLSHSRGSAALLCGPGHLSAGVDIEAMQPRDFAALAQWMASEEEAAALASDGLPAGSFYELWTLKEALLKAAGLDFPADMKRVGWTEDAAGVRRLHAAGMHGWHGVTAEIGGRFMLACVWRGAARLVWRVWPPDEAPAKIKTW